MEGYTIMAEARVQLAETLHDPLCDGSSRKAAEGGLQSHTYDISAYFHAVDNLMNRKSSPDLREIACRQLLQALQYPQHLSPPDRMALIARLFPLLGDNNPRIASLAEACLTVAIGDTRGNAEFEGYWLVVEMAKTGLDGAFVEVAAAVRAIKLLATISTESNWEALLRFYTDISGRLAVLVFSCIDSGSIVAGTVELLETWATVVKMVAQLSELSLSIYFHDLVNDVQTANTMEKVLLATVDGGVLAATDSPDSSVFNSLKTTLLQALTQVFQYLSSERHEWEHSLSAQFSLLEIEPLPPSPFLTCICRVLGPYLQTCSFLSISPQSPSLSAAIREVMKIATFCLAEQSFAGYFAESYKSLIADLCLPLLISPQSELNLVSTQPEEFVHFAVDTCGFHKYQSVKTLSALFLTSICRRVDGALTFATVSLSQFLTNSFSENSDWSTASLLENEQVGCDLLGLLAETKAEVALLALAVLSEPVLQRSDLKRLLTHTISTVFRPLIAVKSQLLRARFCLFLEHYIPEIATTDEDLYALLRFLLTCVDSRTEPRVVYLQSCHSLHSIISRKTAIQRIAPVADFVVKGLLAVLPGQREKTVYETLEDLILLHPSAGLANFENILKTAVSIILQQTILQCSVPGSTRNTIVMTRCWLIARALADTQGALPKYGELLETALTPLLDFLKNPQNIDFEDEVVHIWTAIVSQSYSVSAVTWQLFPMLPLIQVKYDGDFGHLYRLLNAIVAHGHFALFDHSERLEVVADMATTALFALQAGVVRESSQAEGLLLLQQILLTGKSEMLDTVLLRIVKAAMRRYSYGCQTVTMKVRVLETILTGFRYNVEVTREALEGQEGLFFGELVTLWHGFVHEYDKKLATVTILHLLTSESIEIPISALFSTLIRILSHCSPCPPSPPDSPSSHDSESDSIRITEETEIYALLSTIFSPLQKVDEIELFRQFVDRAVRTQGQRWAEVIQSLTKEESMQLSDILHSWRLPVAEFRTSVRRIVRAKRRLVK